MQGNKIYGSELTGGDLELYASSHATPGEINLNHNATFKRLAGSAVPGSADGSLINLTLGTELAPLAAGQNDIPILINHRVGSIGGGLSYGIRIITYADAIDTGTGLMVENTGFADGATFAITDANASIGACAIAAFQNHTLDVHEQYVMSLKHCHGRSILIQSQGVGEAIEIWRNANNAGTPQSGAHIYITEDIGSYGHLVGFKMVGNASGTDSDAMLQIFKGATKTLEIQQAGNVVANAFYMANNQGLFMKNVAGDGWVNVLYLSDGNSMVIGAGLAANNIWANVDGTLRQVTAGAPNSGGDGYRLIRIPNAA